MCRPVVPEPRTTAFEDERHARLRALSRSVGTAEGVLGHRSVSVACQLCYQSRRGVARSARQPHTAGCLQLHNFSHTRGAPTIQTDAHNMGREERRALLEQRRAALVRQLRGLAIELTDIDRQLDEIEQSER